MDCMNRRGMSRCSTLLELVPGTSFETIYEHSVNSLRKMDQLKYFGHDVLR